MRCLGRVLRSAKHGHHGQVNHQKYCEKFQFFFMIEILRNKFSNAESTYNDCSHFMTGIRAKNKNVKRFDNRSIGSGVLFVNSNTELVKRFSWGSERRLLCYGSVLFTSYN
jgi:hypothetical protein